jgi:hypothetical protein
MGLISAVKGVLKLVPRQDKRIKCLGNLLKNKDTIFDLETPGKFFKYGAGGGWKRSVRPTM